MRQKIELQNGATIYGELNIRIESFFYENLPTEIV